MKYEEFFRTHPIFTGAELDEYMSSRGQVGERAREALLAYYRKVGWVTRVRRGLYAVTPRGSNAATYPVDPFLIASRLTKDAVLAYHTALEFRGSAYSMQNYFTYAALRPLNPVTFHSYLFRGVRFPQALLQAGRQDFGIVTADRAGMSVRVTSPERTLVEVLDRPDLSGSWEEVWRSLESIEFFDLDEVVDYIKLLGNATLAAKVGFFLEQHREPLMVEEGYLKTLHALQPRHPHYLERGKRESGRLAPGWNLVVPQDVFERSWADVL